MSLYFASRAQYIHLPDTAFMYNTFLEAACKINTNKLYRMKKWGGLVKSGSHYSVHEDSFRWIIFFIELSTMKQV